jgi:uncharacterized membrane protein YhiD involved in acid resistance
MFQQIQSFEEFLATQSAQIPMANFVLNLILAAILAFILRFIYVKYGNALSNRKSFAWNFILITMTTMLIISVVKSSLALSLGLVGALSIVRFRTAIKEPEELSYLFLAIAVGLGLGADQTAITLIAFVIIVSAIWLMKRARRSEDDQNLYLTISTHNPGKAELEDIVRVLRAHCPAVSLKRFDDSGELLEAAFLVEFDDFPQLEATKSELHGLDESIRITFLDNKGLGSI